MNNFYLEIGQEKKVFEAAFKRKIPLMLVGPTGCGKSRFVEHMANLIGRPLFTIVCNDETSTTDLLGRYLIKGGETIWQDGPVLSAIEAGAILYLDEVVEAREDIIVILHSLSDHRREIHVDKKNSIAHATSNFMLVASYNPLGKKGLKGLRESTRQRFVTLDFSYPPFEKEVDIVSIESGLDRNKVSPLVKLAGKFRGIKDQNYGDGVSTRSLIATAKLIAEGIHPRTAFKIAAVNCLSDEPEWRTTFGDLVDISL
jgi:nitric oxide reductase NorQ protein